MRSSDPSAAYDDHDTAQICLRGHVINGQYNDRPEFNKDFCTKCGAPTITTCQKCGNPIRGKFRRSHVVGWSSRDRPLFCHECGEPYPWTDEYLKAAKELADEAPNLTDKEKKQLDKDITDLVLDAPRAAAAASSLDRLVAKAGDPTKNAIKEFLSSIASSIASDTLVKLMRG